MKTMQDSELTAVVGGDSFWRDFGQFIGGAIGSVVNGYPTLYPGTVGASSIGYGIIAAMIN
ncbi:MAG TPA: hypothetical protein VMB21_04910 [Candidatus Limnocylindria bacterium]|jgi:hypothetical protein|nr:hypothetical protein [Candidatus Limnocylindria bacterium]HTL67177.1 hypothetical protein [Lacunisphaera sp.]